MSGSSDFARRFWDSAYARDDHLEHWHREPPGRALARALPSVAPEARILDLGCGTGAEASWLASRGFDVVGVDLSLAALARASAAGDGPPWSRLVGSAFELPVAGARFDLVLDAGCLHSIGCASRGLYAAEVLRVTTPGAQVLIRGARRDDDEEGVVGVDTDRCRSALGPDFRVEWSLPLVLPADRGALDGVGVLLRRRAAEGG